MNTIADYGRVIPGLRAAMGPHVVELLRGGLSVVLDWPANTVISRRWMRGIFETAGSAHRLHLHNVADEVCRARLQWRNASGRHEYTLSDAEFAEFTSHFEPPTLEEGFDIVEHIHC